MELEQSYYYGNMELEQSYYFGNMELEQSYYYENMKLEQSYYHGKMELEQPYSHGKVLYSLDTRGKFLIWYIVHSFILIKVWFKQQSPPGKVLIWTGFNLSCLPWEPQVYAVLSLTSFVLNSPIIPGKFWSEQS